MARSDKTLEDIFDDKDMNVLFAEKLPDGITVNGIVFDTIDSKEKIVFLFDNPNFTYTVILDEYVSEEIKNVSTEIVKINGIDCYVIDKRDVGIIQIYFEYNDNLYKTTYMNKQGLIEVIENLKELK